MKKVLFVCVENSCRSQIAEAFAKIQGQVEAYSAGSKPSGMVNPQAIKTMQEIGYDLSSHYSKSLDDIPNIDYAFAITMGCGDECPHVKAQQRQDWAIPDPKHMNPQDFAEIRDLIAKKVKHLMLELG
jgi:protein-tyrosine-phosphatase